MTVRRSLVLAAALMAKLYALPHAVVGASGSPAVMFCAFVAIPVRTASTLGSAPCARPRRRQRTPCHGCPPAPSRCVPGPACWRRAVRQWRPGSRCDCDDDHQFYNGEAPLIATVQRFLFQNLFIVAPLAMKVVDWSLEFCMLVPHLRGAVEITRTNTYVGTCFASTCLPEPSRGTTVTKSLAEGLVAKDEQARYAGGPTTAWRKVKVRHEGRLLIGGIVDDQGDFGGLLVGELVAGELFYRGTGEWGFTGWAIVDLLVRSKPLVRATSPFADKTARHGVIWLEPLLTAEISYAEVMLGRLRGPVFRRLLGQERCVTSQ